MRVKALAVLLVGFLIAADDTKGDNKKDMDKMQGEWTMVSGERDGQAIPEEFAQALKRTIKGDHYSVKREDNPLISGTYTIDASKNPKTIDLKVTEGEGDLAGQTMHGIYELHDDTFKICYAGPGKDRPTEFSAKAGSGNTCATWKRSKK
jgi:uncharacterized protein (TIGR03067 family)